MHTAAVTHAFNRPPSTLTANVIVPLRAHSVLYRHDTNVIVTNLDGHERRPLRNLTLFPERRLNGRLCPQASFSRIIHCDLYCAARCNLCGSPARQALNEPGCRIFRPCSRALRRRPVLESASQEDRCLAWPAANRTRRPRRRVAGCPRRLRQGIASGAPIAQAARSP